MPETYDINNDFESAIIAEDFGEVARYLKRRFDHTDDLIRRLIDMQITQAQLDQISAATASTAQAITTASESITTDVQDAASAVAADNTPVDITSILSGISDLATQATTLAATVKTDLAAFIPAPAPDTATIAITLTDPTGTVANPQALVSGTSYTLGTQGTVTNPTFSSSTSGAISGDYVAGASGSTDVISASGQDSADNNDVITGTLNVTVA